MQDLNLLVGENPPKRVPRASVRIHPDFIAEFVREGYTLNGKITCYKGVPKDAQLVNIFFDAWKHLFVLTFEHESFDKVADGELLPEITVWYITERFSEENNAHSTNQS